MHPDDTLVALVGLPAHGVPHRVGEPPAQVVSNDHALGVIGKPTVSVCHRPGELLRDFASRLAIDSPLLGTLGSVDRVAAHPAPVLAAGDRAFPVATPPSHRHPPSQAPRALPPAPSPAF